MATQRQTVGGTITCSTPLKDDTLTVIDGGHITTGTIDTNRLDANTIKSNIVQTTNLSADKITSGDISADRIKVNVIDAINSLTIGQINAARIEADQLTIGQTQVSGLTDTLNNKASITDVTNAINNISVGGRNLLTGTADYSTESTANQTGITVSSDTFGGTKVLVGTWSSGNMDMGRFANAFSISLQPDSDYTLSFWAKATAAINVVSYLFIPSTVASGENSSENTTTASDGAITTTLSTEWERYWVTWHTSTVASQATQVIAARVGSGASGETIYLAGVKFEQGNIATD